MEKVVIYCRISTSKQKIMSQRSNVLDFCTNKKWSVVSYFEDINVSGLKKSRPGFDDMLEYIRENKINKIVVSELSRLGRDTFSLKELICEMYELGVSIYCVDIEIETMINNKLNVNAIPVLMNEIDYANREIDKVQKRFMRGYQNRLLNGGFAGRKKGSKETEAMFLLKHEDIIHFLNSGYSCRLINIVTNKSTNTVLKVKKTLMKNENWVEPDKKIGNWDILKKIVEGNEDIVKEALLFDEIKK
jgi:DNA invertase Pin-like site-specific DNA recombinase